jgi:hypothetical protein
VYGVEYEDIAVWFCNCQSREVNIYRTIEVLHTSPRAWEELQSASCACVKYCKWAVQQVACSTASDVLSVIIDIIKNRPVHVFVDDNGDTLEADCEEGQGKEHKWSKTPVIPLQGSSSTSQLTQVGTWGGPGLPCGILVNGTCVTCKNSSQRCVHRSVYNALSSSSNFSLQGTSSGVNITHPGVLDPCTFIGLNLRLNLSDSNVFDGR